jgi:predicted transcriptional regulator
MTKDAVFTLKLEPELRDRFIAAAKSVDRPASQLVREMMREFVDSRLPAQEHEAWFRSEVEDALREADDPGVERVPDEEIALSWATDRTDLIARSRG